MIDAHARNKLERSLRKHGLVGPVVWNERTGNLVGGHQRIKILDALEGRADYQLTVAAVDLDERDEKKLCILLNNRSAQGDWDPVALERLTLDLVREDPDAMADMGFDPIELHLICDTEEFGTILSDRNDKARITIEELREIENKGKEKTYAKGNADHFVVLVFASAEQVAAFREAVGIEADAEFVSGNRIRHMVGKAS